MTAGEKTTSRKNRPNRDSELGSRGLGPLAGVEGAEPSSQGQGAEPLAELETESRSER